MMLNIFLWKWRQRPVFREQYKSVYINEAARQISEKLSLPHRIVCITDDPRGVKCETRPIWNDHGHVPNMSGSHLPSCYRRLKLFDPATLESLGVSPGQRVVSVDADVLVTGSELDPLFDRVEPLVAWVVRGGRRTSVINGSMLMFTAGEYDWVWKKFDPRSSPLKSHNAGFMGSDQGWLSYCLVDRPEIGCWNRADGVLSFTRDVVKALRPPESGRIVFFAGARKPWHAEMQRAAPWILRYANYQEEVENVAVAS